MNLSQVFKKQVVDRRTKLTEWKYKGNNRK